MKIRILLFALLMISALAGPAGAWVRGYQPFPEGETTVVVHKFCFTASAITNGVDPCHRFTDQEWHSVIRQAFNAWNEVGANFVFRERPARPNEDPCAYRTGAQRKDVYVILASPDDLCRRDGPLNSARVEFAPSAIRIYINTVIEMTTGTVQSLLIHEFGHVVGLGHPDEAGQHVRAIMNGWVLYDTLQPDDIEGILALYGERALLTGFLENPRPGSNQSGLGVISGWVCEAGQVMVRVLYHSSGAVIQLPAAYGTERADTGRVVRRHQQRLWTTVQLERGGWRMGHGRSRSMSTAICWMR